MRDHENDARDEGPDARSDRVPGDGEARASGDYGADGWSGSRDDGQRDGERDRHRDGLPGDRPIGPGGDGGVREPHFGPARPAGPRMPSRREYAEPAFGSAGHEEAGFGPGMGHRAQFVRPGFPGPQAAASSEDPGWDVLVRLWRRKGLILSVTALAGLAAFGFTKTLEPRYGTEARVMVGTQEAEVTDIKAVLETLAPDSDMVHTEAHVIASRPMANEVARSLELDHSALFNPTIQGDPGLLERWGVNEAIAHAKSFIVGLLPNAANGNATDKATASPAPESEAARQQRIWQIIEGRLLSRVRVEPLNRSTIIGITAETRDPELSARIANRFAEVYSKRSLASREQAAGRANEWLDQRLATLRTKVEQSEQAVEAYRVEHDLFSTKSQTVVDQRMSALNERLVDAQGEVADAEARLAQAQALKGEGGDLQSVPAVLQSDQILSLRNQLADLERRAAELSSDYTDKHPKIQTIRAQIDDVEGEINAEIDRIVSSLGNELSIAEENHDRVVAQMQEIQGNVGASNEAAVRLRELEREAEANRSLYESLLKRSKETSYQASLMTPGVEIISRAPTPLSPSFPPSNLILALGGLVGVGLGVLAALLIEKLDRTFRTPEDVEEWTGVPALAVLPSVKARRSGRFDHVLKNPNSPYADGLRMMDAQLALGGYDGAIPGLTIFTSAAEGEGKSHTSCAYAQILAGDGRKVVLVDLDWRQPTQHRLFGKKFRRRGLIDLLNGEAAPDDVLFEDTQSGVHVISTGRMSRMRRDRVSFDRLRNLLETLARHYDAVVVDTSPLHVTPEILHLARLAESVVVAVKWGATPRKIVQSEIKNLARAGVPLSGIVLTQVEPKRYKRYNYTDSGYMHHGYLAHAG